MLKKAVAAGLCEQHTKAWDKNWNVKELLEYYKTNPNWCLERHFPSKEILEKYQDNSMGIYVGKTIPMRATERCYIFIDCMMGIITNAVTRFYFGLNSRASIVVEDGGDLAVDVYDNTELKIELRGSARCTVYQYGENVPEITGSKNFKIRNKRKSNKK